MMRKRAHRQRLAEPPHTVGEAEIRCLVDTLSISAIAHHCGVTVSVVAAWTTGFKIPGRAQSKVLSEFDVRPRDWTTPAHRR